MEQTLLRLFKETQGKKMDGGSYTGGRMRGGRGTAAAFAAAARNPWIQHVRNYARTNGISYAAAVTEARASYQPTEGYEARRARAAPFLGKKNPRPKGRHVRAVRPSDTSAARLAQLAAARAKRRSRKS